MEKQEYWKRGVQWVRKNRIWNLAADVFQPLGANIPGLPLVELLGNSRMLVENHKGLICYSTEEVQIKVKGGLLCVNGKGLSVCKMTNCALVIKGCICSLEFLEGSR